MNNLKKILCFTGLFFALPFFVLAVTETGVGSNITTEVTPRNPAPGSMVSISLTGFGFDRSKALYEWRQDGELKISAIGVNKFSFQLGQLGTPTKIKASVYYNKRHLADKNFYFEPSDISLVWQADTLTPPFYQGKARPSAGATIKVSATPYLVNNLGQLLKTSDLIYNWYINESLDKENSGRGKNVIIIPTKDTDSQKRIGLQVTSADGKSNASKDLLVYLDKPKIAFYEQTPLEGGNYKKQITNTYELYGEEASFIAVPLFWPINYISNLNYVWRVNNLSSPNTATPDILTVRQPSGGAGTNEVNLQISDGVSNKNSINGHFSIKFGNNLLKSYNVN